MLGRKGAGKTALLNFVEQHYAERAFFFRLTFNPQLLRGWGRQLDNANPLTAADYESLWTAFIHHEFCRVAVSRGAISGSLKTDISIRHDVPGPGGPAKFLRRLLYGVRSLTIGFRSFQLTSDGEIQPAQLREYRNNRDWHEYLAICKADAEAVAAQIGKPCIALCDEIDLRIDTQDHMRFNDYTNCVRGLLNTAAQLQERHVVSSIIALRSDIFDAIIGAELNAWNGRILRVEANEDRIKELLLTRIRRSLPEQEAKEIASFDSAWARVSVAGYVDFDFIRQRTLNRPRDYVEYLSLAAKYQLQNDAGSEKIAGTAFRGTTLAFAQFLLNEFCDEIYFKYDFGRSIVEALRYLYPPAALRQNFTYSDFRRSLGLQGVDLPEQEMRELVRDLYRMSVLGFQSRQESGLSPMRFLHQNDAGQLPPVFWQDDIVLVLHRGFRHALTG